jgi:hypothetical protein
MRTSRRLVLAAAALSFASCKRAPSARPDGARAGPTRSREQAALPYTRGSRTSPTARFIIVPAHKLSAVPDTIGLVAAPFTDSASHTWRYVPESVHRLLVRNHFYDRYTLSSI